MRYTKNIDRHQKNKKNKPLDAPNIDRHQKKQKFQQLLRSGPIVPGNFSFFCFFWCLCRFGASSGLFFFVFFGVCAGLVTLTSQNIDRHQKNQKNQTTRCTKPRQAPKKTKKKIKFQQLLRSGPIVPGNFSFFCFFGACAGLVHLVVSFFCFFWCLCRFGDSDFTKHWQAPKKPNH